MLGSATVVAVALGAAAAGVAIGTVSAYLVTTSLIEVYLRHSRRWKDYSLPIIPWTRGTPHTLV